MAKPSALWLSSMLALVVKAKRSAKGAAQSNCCPSQKTRLTEPLPSNILPSFMRGQERRITRLNSSTGELPLTDAGEAAQRDGSFVWVGVYEPTEEEFDAVRREFDLHELAVEERSTRTSGRRSSCTATRCWWSQDGPSRRTRGGPRAGEILLFVNRDFVVTVRHGESGLHDVRWRSRTGRTSRGTARRGAVRGRRPDRRRLRAGHAGGRERHPRGRARHVFARAADQPAPSGSTQMEREVLDLHRAIDPARAARSTGWPAGGRDRAPGAPHVLPRRARPPAAAGRPDRGLPRSALERARRRTSRRRPCARTRTCARSRRGWRSSPSRPASPASTA